MVRIILPDRRRVSRTAQLFSGEKHFTWRIKQDAASNMITNHTDTLQSC